MKHIAQSYASVRNHTALFTQILLAACLVVVFLYAVNVYKIIWNTVLTKHVESEIVSAQKSVQDLDAKYFALTNKITPDLEKEYGLSENKVEAYITRLPSLGRALSFGGSI